MLRVMEKAVLLHPLSEGTRGQARGERKRKFFESLRPAQDRRRGSAARDRNLQGRNTKENIKAEPEIQSRTFKKSNSTTKSLILAQDER